MGKKFIYNVLLNIGIIVMFFGAISAWQSQQYVLVAGAVIVFVLLAGLKYRLLKDVKANIQDRSKLP